MVCLDTDILIGLLHGDRAAIGTLEKIGSAEKSLRTTVITAYELLKGAAISSEPEQNTLKVRQLLSNMDVLILTMARARRLPRYAMF